MNYKLIPLCLVGMSLSAGLAAEELEDKYIWLEDVDGVKPMKWVKQKNAHSAKDIKSYAGFDKLVSNSLDILNDKERIPYASRKGDFLYNFWKDEQHTRGIYRRTTIEEYGKASPKWETVLDIDALGKTEGVNWVYKGMNCLYPTNERCFVSLSRGGADAVEIREFDLNEKRFIPVSEKGFFLKEAKSDLSWIDKNTVFVGTAFDADSMTDSGYPRVVKKWKRGTKLKEAELVFSGDKKSVAIGANTVFDGKTPFNLVSEYHTFYTASHSTYKDGQLISLPLPEDAEIKGIFNGLFFIELKSDLNLGHAQYKQGSVVYTAVDKLVSGKPSYQLLAAPSQSTAISQVSFTRDSVYINWLDNVKSKLVRYQMDKAGNWQSANVPFPANGALSVFDISQLNDDFFVSYTGFLTPPSLYSVDSNTLKSKKLKAMKAKFDSSKFETKQYFAQSADGTKVPYFVVMAKNTKLDGKNPTLLYGYGGFEVSLRPKYSATIGKNWLEQGGIYVLSNIRGGGEYGPAWHQAALKENRHKAYEDFEAIAEDLIKRKLTSSRHLGIQGGSNGGLLMGAAFTRRPDLYNAVVCQVPLLDMKRFNKLLAGASWMGEYGNPDVESEWQYIKTFSPYHNVHKGKQYPKVFFTTSTRDDRVHPGHARKMVAKMEGLGYQVLYYENIEGGHAGAADNNQAAELNSMTFAYLLKQLK